MREKTMLGKYFKNKELCQLCKNNSIMYRNENYLLSKLVDNYQNSIKLRE